MRVEEFGFDDWVDDLDQSGKSIVPEVERVTSKTCLEIKKHAQGLVRGIAHAPNLGRTFTYDVDERGGTVIGEVGADTEKRVGGGRVRTPGDLDHFIENGSIRNAPIPHWRPAVEKQVPLWEKYLARAAAEALDAR